MIDPAAVFRKRADARYRNVGGEGVVVRQEAGEVLVVNEVGARVLDLVDAQTPVDALVDALAAEYDADRATLERDVAAYLRELVDAGIIERVAAPDAG